MIKKIAIFALMILTAAVFFWIRLGYPVDANGMEKIFIVSQGQTGGQVADNLKKENLIRSVFYFKYGIWRRKPGIKAGEYLISQKSSAEEIIKILTNGEAISREKSITIVEGWNSEAIGNYLEKNTSVKAKYFASLANAPIGKWKFNFAKPAFLNDAPSGANLEGYLFPDTYRIFNDASAEEIIFKMLENFGAKLPPDIKQAIIGSKKTIYEITTMASIIEKEVRSREDMKIVSGIFWDRIKNVQPLESCATLAYILKINKPQYSIEDTKIDSPYNTYKYRGLPPGPIANPGLNAIMAAIDPEYTDYNYFLSDPAAGKTIFSKTFSEHILNKRQYLK